MSAAKMSLSIQQVAEVKGRGLVRNSVVVQLDSYEKAHRLAVLQPSALQSIHWIDCHALEPTAKGSRSANQFCKT